MIKSWIARRLMKWFGARLTRRIAAEHMKSLQAGRPKRPADADAALSERPDIAKRRAFFRDHILVHTHVPKAAGSSFSAGLASIVGGVHFVDMRLGRSANLADLSPEDMDAIYGISSHMGFGLHELFERTPLYFATVRDPVDRAVSYYRYLQNRPTEFMSRHAIGLDFDASWRAIDAEGGPDQRNLQSRILCSRVDDRPLDEDLLWRRVKEDYFLVIPHDKVSKAIEHLQTAFGTFRSPSAQVNVSTAAAVTPSHEIRTEIRSANAVDQKLYDHVIAHFDDNLARACKTIAHHCLQPLETG